MRVRKWKRAIHPGIKCVFESRPQKTKFDFFMGFLDESLDNGIDSAVAKDEGNGDWLVAFRGPSMYYRKYTLWPYRDAESRFFSEFLGEGGS